MNKKEILKKILLIIIFILIIISSFLVTRVFMENFKKDSVETSIVKDFTKFVIPLDTPEITKESAITVITIALNNLNGTQFDADKYKEDLENIKDPSAFTINDTKYTLKINLLTEEIIQFSDNSGKKYKTTKMKEEQAVKISDEIIEKLKLPTVYECIYIYPFDDELFGATYQAKYGEIYNQGQIIKMYFSPTEKKVFNLYSHGNTKALLGNTEISINKDEAKKVAEMLANKNGCNVVREKTDIVETNYFWADNSNNEDLNIYRLAYIFTCNDKDFTQIYVDGSTGEIIGGDKSQHSGMGVLLPEPDSIIYYIDKQEKFAIEKQDSRYSELFNSIISEVPEKDFMGHHYALLWEEDKLEDYKKTADHILFQYNNIQNISNYEFNEIFLTVVRNKLKDKDYIILFNNGKERATFGGFIPTTSLINKLDNM